MWACLSGAVWEEELSLAAQEVCTGHPDGGEGSLPRSVHIISANATDTFIKLSPTKTRPIPGKVFLLNTQLHCTTAHPEVRN